MSEQLEIVPELTMTDTVLDNSHDVATADALYAKAERLWQWLWREDILSWSAMTFALLDLDSHYFNAENNEAAIRRCQSSIDEATAWREKAVRA